MRAGLAGGGAPLKMRGLIREAEPPMETRREMFYEGSASRRYLTADTRLSLRSQSAAQSAPKPV
ncbi:hypothetical protein [Robiginitomaculum antarcticum]|uniref:hypothetical protein n=1 Tax=Robiginitomaculum antarcticum TaxID=437507 RepID=UPI00036E351D|nr:hypothetical protein [Robiginitomaculum antarcticum]